MEIVIVIMAFRVPKKTGFHTHSAWRGRKKERRTSRQLRGSARSFFPLAFASSRGNLFFLFFGCCFLLVGRVFSFFFFGTLISTTAPSKLSSRHGISLGKAMSSRLLSCQGQMFSSLETYETVIALLFTFVPLSDLL